MSATISAARDPERAGGLDASVVVLWVCIALFFLRVIGQIEVLLVAPAWLPEMSAWYSGLLPYPVLLPSQIGLLMLMCALVIRRSTLGSQPVGSRIGNAARIWRALAIFYFAVMAVRLVWCIYTYGGDFYLHGAIPIAFHWVLALFALGCTRRRCCPDALGTSGESRS